MEVLSSFRLIFLVAVAGGIQFQNDEDDLTRDTATAANSRQSQSSAAVGFFPTSEEERRELPQKSDERYSEISGISYIDPYESSNSDNRKQLNFNGNPPTGPGQFYQPSQPPKPSSVTRVRKRPAYLHQQQQQSPAAQQYYSSYPTTDHSNPYYQNYANQYQHPLAATVPSTTAAQIAANYHPADFYQPTRYPSAAHQLYHQQQLLQQQPTSQSPNYYTNNYANQYQYGQQQQQQQQSSGLATFLNNLRGGAGSPFGQISSLGGQFGKALDDITTHDDLQCVPKVLCQMVQGSRRPGQSSQLMNIPGLSMLITALPSTSPMLTFGRAALLGFSPTGNCDIGYPRCPRDEEQILFYLNNHKGGFFRFFNGGQSFGGDDNYVQQQLQQLQASQSQQQPIDQQQGLSLLALQALADSLNNGGQNSNSNNNKNHVGGGGGGFSLNNLFSTVQRPAAAGHYSQQGLQADKGGVGGGFFSDFIMKPVSDAVSNLLTGIVGTRFSSRRFKRSDDDHRIQKRIVNLSPSQRQQYDDHRNTLYDVDAPLKFSGSRDQVLQSSPQSQSSSHYYQRLQQQLSPTTTTTTNQDSSNSIQPSDVARFLQELFPEKSGHLRVDDDQYNRQLLRALVNERISKILTGVQQTQQQRPINNNYSTHHRYQSAQSPNYSGHAQQQYTNYYAGSQGASNYNRAQPNNDRSNLVYVTDSRGQLDYVLNEKTGQKQRVYK